MTEAISGKEVVGTKDRPNKRGHCGHSLPFLGSVFSLAEGKNDPPFTPGEGTPGGAQEITSARLCTRKQDKLL